MLKGPSAVRETGRQEQGLSSDFQVNNATQRIWASSTEPSHHPQLLNSSSCSSEGSQATFGHCLILGISLEVTQPRKSKSFIIPALTTHLNLAPLSLEDEEKDQLKDGTVLPLPK